MVKRLFIVIVVSASIVFVLFPNQLYAPSESQDKTMESVKHLYEIILNGPEEKIIPARAKIREIMESYFRDQGIKLKSYYLPVRHGRWKITQGNTTKYTHQGENQFSWDFELVDVNGCFHADCLPHREKPKENYSYGMPIYAVETGRVWLRDGGEDGKEPSNIIVIYHNDGTKAIYDHIRPDGFKVKKGERVKRGQLIGYIGYTGTSYPHIHFSIRMKKADNWTLPVRFKRYFLINPKTSDIKRVYDGVPLEGDIVAATFKEAETPSIPEKER
jgi:hypothetical protein